MSERRYVYTALVSVEGPGFRIEIPQIGQASWTETAENVMEEAQRLISMHLNMRSWDVEERVWIEYRAAT